LSIRLNPLKPIQYTLLLGSLDMGRDDSARSRSGSLISN